MATDGRFLDGDSLYDLRAVAEGLREQARNWLKLSTFYRATRPTLAEEYERIANFDMIRAQRLEDKEPSLPVDTSESY